MVNHSGHGLCRNARHDLGMAHRHGLHSMRRPEHGRAVFGNAYQRRTILRRGSLGPSRMGSSGLLSVPGHLPTLITAAKLK